MIINQTTMRRTASGEVLPCDPDFTRWIERVNGGARFRLDFRDELSGPEGEPLLRLPLARAGEAGYTLAEIALYLYNRGVGALLTHSADATGVVGPEADCFPLSLGDLVDYLQTGVLLDRVPGTPPWGYPDLQAEYPPAGWIPLDEIVLPVNTRRQLAWLFQQIGATEFGVSLMQAANGLQTYWFSFKTAQPLSPESFQAAANRIFWYLPRYGAVVVDNVEDGRVLGYPLQFSSPKRKPTKPRRPRQPLRRGKRRRPRGAALSAPHFAGDARESLVQLLAESVERQFQEIERSPKFQRAQVPIGPASKFEMGCFHRTFLRRELLRPPHASPETAALLTDCDAWLTRELRLRYRAEAIDGLVRERLDHYTGQSETLWDEETDSWGVLYHGLSDSLWERIAMHQSYHELQFGAPLPQHRDISSLRILLGMQFDLGTSCLMTITPLVYTVRRWLATGRFFALTPTELSALADAGRDEAETVLILQAQHEDEDEEEETDEEDPDEEDPDRPRA